MSQDRAQVRLAELVGALSLGIDLGFGQPMEHVLRQCLIAVRIAERVGLDEAAPAGLAPRLFRARLDSDSLRLSAGRCRNQNQH